MDIEREEHLEDSSFKQETASEIAPRLPSATHRDEPEDTRELTNTSLIEVQEATDGGAALGVTGLLLSIASLFLLPFLLSLLGIGAGFFAYRRGSRSMGRWAIGIGILSLVGSMIFAPFLG